MRAFSFISATNCAREPATPSASAIAASFPDGSSRPCSSASIVTWRPFGSRPTPEPW